MDEEIVGCRSRAAALLLVSEGGDHWMGRSCSSNDTASETSLQVSECERESLAPLVFHDVAGSRFHARSIAAS